MEYQRLIASVADLLVGNIAKSLSYSTIWESNQVIALVCTEYEAPGM